MILEALNRAEPGAKVLGDDDDKTGGKRVALQAGKKFAAAMTPPCLTMLGRMGLLVDSRWSQGGSRPTARAADNKSAQACATQIGGEIVLEGHLVFDASLDNTAYEVLLSSRLQFWAATGVVWLRVFTQGGSRP